MESRLKKKEKGKKNRKTIEDKKRETLVFFLIKLLIFTYTYISTSIYIYTCMVST